MKKFRKMYTTNDILTPALITETVLVIRFHLNMNTPLIQTLKLAKSMASTIVKLAPLLTARSTWGTQKDTHRGGALQVWTVQQDFLPRWQSEQARCISHHRETVQVQVVWWALHFEVCLCDRNLTDHCNFQVWNQIWLGVSYTGSHLHRVKRCKRNCSL